MYWSDCSGVATIQSARIEDGGDRQTLISDDQHSCIVDIAIDFDSTYFIINLSSFNIYYYNRHTNVSYSSLTQKLNYLLSRSD